MRAHAQKAMAEFTDEELGTTQRVLAAMSGALKSHYDEVVAQR